jgi:peroxiredoxin
VKLIAYLLLVSLLALPIAAQPQRSAGRQQPSGPQIGDQAPDFRLKTKDGQREVQLSSFKAQKPVVLVFGSFT